MMREGSEEFQADEVIPTVPAMQIDQNSDEEEQTPNFDLLTRESQSTPAAEEVEVGDLPQAFMERQDGDLDANERTCKIFLICF